MSAVKDQSWASNNTSNEVEEELLGTTTKQD
jgi:hypothetical protein